MTKQVLANNEVEVTIEQEKAYKAATEKWLSSFQRIPFSLMTAAYSGDNIDNLTERTKFGISDTVYSNEHNCEATVIEVDFDENEAKIEIDGEIHEVEADELHVEHDSWLPMWGTMWLIDESLDSDWITENLGLVSGLGFRIYEDDVEGHIYIGIDGAGYDFYEAHWIPLYKARGLMWHNFS